MKKKTGNGDAKGLDDETASKNRIERDRLFEYQRATRNFFVASINYPKTKKSEILTRSVDKVIGRLLILVDEYDKPIREGLLSLVPRHGAGPACMPKSKPAKITNDCLFVAYFGFFGAR